VLAGSFALSVSSDEVAISAAATLTLRAGGIQMLSLDASGALLVRANGIAGKVALTLRANGGPSPALGFNFSGNLSFTLEVNTTNTSVATINNVAVDLEAGIYGRILVAGDLNVQGLVISGTFGLTVSNLEVAISASASLALRAGGVQVLAFDVLGAMRISSSGLAAKLALSLAANGGPAPALGFEFSGSLTFTLEINTTNAQVQTINNVTVNLPAGIYGRVIVAGALRVMGLELVGTFGLSVSTTEVAISATATLTLQAGGIRVLALNASGALVVRAAGIAGKVTLSLQGGGAPDASLGFTLEGSLAFTLEINTSTSPVTTINNVTVNLAAGPYARVAVTGTLKVGGFDLVGSFVMSVSSTNISVAATATV
jgi:hypothetical protein